MRAALFIQPTISKLSIKEILYHGFRPTVKSISSTRIAISAGTSNEFLNVFIISSNDDCETSSEIITGVSDSRQ